MHLKTFFILLLVTVFHLSAYAQYFSGKVTDEIQKVPSRLLSGQDLYTNMQ